MKKLSMMASAMALVLAGCNATPENNITALDVTFDKTSQNYQLNWQASDAAQPVSVYVASDVQGNEMTKLGEATASSFTWHKSGEFERKYFTVKPENGDATTAASRLLPLEKGRNFRELGGYKNQDGQTVKWGKIFRSGALANLTAADYAYLSELNIRTVVDFRDNKERATEVTNWQAGDIEHIMKDYGQVMDMKKFAKVLMDPTLNEEKATYLFAQMYPGIAEQQKENYTAMFDRMATKGEPILFHCTAGKDRTGVAGVLILTALGVDKETAIQDYLLSEQYLDPEELFHTPDDMSPEQAQMYGFFKQLPKEVVQVFAGVRRPMIESAIASMEEKSGSVLNYIQTELDVSDEELAMIRKHYLN